MSKALYYLSLALVLIILTPLFLAASVLGSGGYWQRLAGFYQNFVRSWEARWGRGELREDQSQQNESRESRNEGDQTMAERAGGVTFKGNPLTVIGEELKAGQEAPDFALIANDMSTVHLKDSNGKVRILSVVPSLDTPVCDQQSKRFNEELGKLGDDVICYTISADLPFAQGRWCGATGCNNVKTLSDHREMSFGDKYGLHVKELRLLQRAVFVVDKDGKITYAEYVPEIAQHPDYEKAIEAAKSAS